MRTATGTLTRQCHNTWGTYNELSRAWKSSSSWPYLWAPPPKRKPVPNTLTLNSSSSDSGRLHSDGEKTFINNSNVAKATWEGECKQMPVFYQLPFLELLPSCLQGKPHFVCLLPGRSGDAFIWTRGTSDLFQGKKRSTTQAEKEQRQVQDCILTAVSSAQVMDSAACPRCRKNWTLCQFPTIWVIQLSNALLRVPRKSG